jgi:hypothetical protein
MNPMYCHSSLPPLLLIDCLIPCLPASLYRHLLLLFIYSSKPFGMLELEHLAGCLPFWEEIGRLYSTVQE